MKRTTQLNLGILVALMATGCATKPKPEPEKIDPVIVELTKLAREIKTASIRNRELIQVNSHNLAEPSIDNPLLQEKLTVLDYSGDAANLLSKIAKMLDWEFKTPGTNVFPVTVVVSADDDTIFNVLRDVGAQVGEGVALAVDEVNQEIRLEYK